MAWAAEQYTETIWSAEALEPSSIVNGSVNVITGQYVEHTSDIRLRGIEPLSALRGVCGGAHSRTNGKVVGWTMGQPSLTTFAKGPANTRRLSDRDILVCDLNGSRILFATASIEPAIWSPKVGVGLCNTGWGEIGGRTNLKNRWVTFSGENRYQLRLGSGQSLLYTCWSDVRDKDVPKRDELSYYLWRVDQPNGHHLECEWEQGEWLLKQVVAKSSDGKRILGFLQYDYSGPNGYAIEGSDGQRVDYTLGPFGRLDKVELKGSPFITYSYNDDNLHRYRTERVRRVTSRWLPGGALSREPLLPRARELVGRSARLSSREELWPS